MIGLALAIVEALVEDGAARDSSMESDRSGRSNPLELPPERYLRPTVSTPWLRAMGEIACRQLTAPAIRLITCKLPRNGVVRTLGALNCVHAANLFYRTTQHCYL